MPNYYMSGYFTTEMSCFPSKLNELLTQTGLDTKQLAGHIGVSEREIINWRRLESWMPPEYTLPSLETVIKVADFFCVPLDFLVGRCTKTESENLQEYFAEQFETLRRDCAFDEPWPYNLVTTINGGAPVEFILTEDRENGLYYALSVLNDREREAVVLRFKEGKTLDEIGAVLGKSKERTRQIISKAIRRLRHPSLSRFVKLGFNLACEDDIANEKRKEIRLIEQRIKEHEARKHSLEERIVEFLSIYYDIPSDQLAETLRAMDYPLENLGLSTRAQNALEKAGIKTYGDLATMSKYDLRMLRDVGEKAYAEITEKFLKGSGIDLRKNE